MSAFFCASVGPFVKRMPRQSAYGKEAIAFRHMIDPLVRKTGAFVNYRHVKHMYPTKRFRMAYDALLFDLNRPKPTSAIPPISRHRTAHDTRRNHPNRTALANSLYH